MQEELTNLLFSEDPANTTLSSGDILEMEEYPSDDYYDDKATARRIDEEELSDRPVAVS